jgi:hypothetical protein
MNDLRFSRGLPAWLLALLGCISPGAGSAGSLRARLVRKEDPLRTRVGECCEDGVR